MIKFLLLIAALWFLSVNINSPHNEDEKELQQPHIQAVSDEQDTDELVIEAMYKELYSGVSDYEMLDENACIEGCAK